MVRAEGAGRATQRGAAGARGARAPSSRQSDAGRRAARTRYARPLAYYVPPRTPASLHGGRRSDVPASALLGTGGYNILTTNPYVINNDDINRCCGLMSLAYAASPPGYFRDVPILPYDRCGSHVMSDVVGWSGTLSLSKGTVKKQNFIKSTWLYVPVLNARFISKKGFNK